MELRPRSLHHETYSLFSESCCLHGAKGRILKALQNNSNSGNASLLLISCDKCTILMYHVNTK